jgi:cellulose synthase/poly-beta-1,6-N-acetylglucosamine synthase-like glycosyltransferase
VAPLFSVVIPTHNRADLLRAALDSVFRQELRNFEVIVVDDGSTDNLSSVRDDFRDRVEFVRQEQTGPGAARNRGANVAQGDYLAFLDSDDLWFPWTLAVYDELIREHHSPAVLSARFVEFSSQSELSSTQQAVVHSESFPDYFASSQRGYFVGGGTAVLRRNEFLKTGGFRAGLVNAEDHDLMMRMGTAPGFVQVLNPVTVAWRRHPQNATANVVRTFEGTRYLVAQERRAAYPGGTERSLERREIIAARLRPEALACLRNGLKSEAWQLYRDACRWHVSLRRWRFLVGFPLMAVSR